MMCPTVSVIIPLYNAEEYIAKAIQSVLKQTFDGLEVIVVDDVSTDNSAAIVKNIAKIDSRVRYVLNSHNGGPGSARNAGIDLARGDWIAMLDADDWLEPSRIEKCLQAAAETRCDLVADNQKFITDLDGSWKYLLVEEKNTTKSYSMISIEDYLSGDRVKRGSRNLGLIKPFIKRSVLFDNNIRYDDFKKLTMGEDFYFLLECIKTVGNACFIYEPLYNYRIYDPASQLKRQTLQSFQDWRHMHARYEKLFTESKYRQAASLMKKRGDDIDRYIQYQKLAQPLKSFQIGEFIVESLRNPKTLYLLSKDFFSNPNTGFLLFRIIRRHFRQKLGY